MGHLVEVCRIVLDGRGSPIDAGVGDPGVDVAGLLAEWEVVGEAVDRLMASGGTRWAGPLVLDAFTHEVDLRYVLGEPVSAEHPAFEWCFKLAVGGWGRSLSARGLPAVLVSVAGMERVAGEGEPAVRVRGERLDVYRALVGRRTYGQIAALDWSGDPGRWLGCFEWGPFTPPERVVEGQSTVKGS
ncbi:MAG TPA: maleylpyruvate isomerase family mycothiol-dependent enzyme [Actinophytocola sp.]|uniref:maleylpyruvate isomerase family mycothiol-dependent enzyme n=1 Tax=Actinophytocola sp. TaxID=1872138 RepID=UPI002DDD9D70|nr:maleylpyruvate isomerase family mycothiol-dependent enzyme [Actinophytocola sp.]HEV2783677.1 maleylpyruvate isomerase family mycothiol-dependent enzyme [Actinophytocola sp.]